MLASVVRASCVTSMDLLFSALDQSFSSGGSKGKFLMVSSSALHSKSPYCLHPRQDVQACRGISSARLTVGNLGREVLSRPVSVVTDSFSCAVPLGQIL